MCSNHFDPAKPRIMSHLVAGYPDDSGALVVAKALVEGGVSSLEIQFPFSDPQADGPVIQTACVRSLAGGFSLAKGFDFVAKAAKIAGPGVPVFIMSYASPVYRKGIPEFCRLAKAAGASGLIVPDLTPDNDEGLYEEGKKQGLHVVPVVAPGIPAARLSRIAGLKPAWVYAALRTGITGARTDIGEDNVAFLKAVAATGADIMAGFGISSHDQVAALAPLVNTVIAGSHFTKAIQNALAAAGAAPLSERALRDAVAAAVKALNPSGAA